MNTLDCTTPAQADVLAAVIGERSYQDQKWGTIQERQKQVGSYLTLMRVHLAEAEAAWATSSGDESALDEMRKVVAIGVACFEQHGVPSRMTASQLGLSRSPSGTVITFDDFVQYGRDNGGNIVNGMPWSFTYKGRAVSHENDKCYLITLIDGAGTTLRFTPDDTLCTSPTGVLFLQTNSKATPIMPRTKSA